MKKINVAVIGGNGQLGSDIVRVFSKDQLFFVYPLTHKDIEILDVASIKKALSPKTTDIVIHTAAYTRVDEAESMPEKAFLINAVGTKNVALYCKKNDKTLVYISTDYVFGLDEKRRKPYIEDDCPGPLNTYGISKLAGECFVRMLLQKYFIIRTSGLFGVAGSSGKGYNFVELMLRLARENGHVRVVDDQISTPTYTLDLAHQLRELIKTNYYGLYHITAEGACSWYEFAEKIFKLTKIKVKLKAVSSNEFPTIASRPYFSVLENLNLKKHKINRMRKWSEGLLDYLIEKKYI